MDFSPELLRKSLIAYVRRTGQPLLADEETRKRLIERGEVEPVGTSSTCWLGALLKTPERVIGVVSVQSYEENSVYSKEDLRILSLAADGITRIIERRLSEGALRASEKLYRGLIEDQTELVFRWRPDWVRTFVNDACCEFFGRPREELLGSNVLTTISEQGREAFRAKIESLTPDQPAATAEHLVLGKKGKTSWIEWTDRAIFDAEGLLLGYQSVGRDVTDRRRLEEQFHQAQKMQAVGVLAGGVAHDFNNLLTGMIGYTSLLLRRWRSDEGTTSDLTQIRNLANRGAALTRQLLAFSRQQPVDPTVVHLNDLIRNILSMLGRLIGEDIELSYEPKADPDCIRADHSQIEQVLMNLAVNAREAMPHGGSLTIGTANAALSAEFADTHPEISAGRYVVMTVSDSGEGMDEPTLQHVFEPFFTTKALGKGTGLGLSTAYGIVREHAGHIEVESAPGKGACFKVYLPATEEKEAPRSIGSRSGSRRKRRRHSGRRR